MSKLAKSAKQIQIDKANATIVIIVSVAAVITAFSLVAVKTLLSQRSYQARVISLQESALKVAKDDLIAVNSLKSTYAAFDGADNNIIGGSGSGVGPQDGSNSKIVLDSLPSQYDFPAMISAIEKLVTDRGLKIASLSGVDDAAQADAASSTSPVPVEMPFQLSVTGSYQSIQDLVDAMARTVRPINLLNLQIAGSPTENTLTISGKTYYQPAKNLNVTTKVIK
ncbi:type 4a pilus biogenesis protein PilO [Polaromonas sp.]|nr:type 4a pilus biogenesis protein PilO [Candidatus Saccharibacteria bacterium]